MIDMMIVIQFSTRGTVDSVIWSCGWLTSQCRQANTVG